MKIFIYKHSFPEKLLCVIVKVNKQSLSNSFEVWKSCCSLCSHPFLPFKNKKRSAKVDLDTRYLVPQAHLKYRLIDIMGFFGYSLCNNITVGF